MNKIHIANLLVTRRCNLRCSYCNLVRDYKGIPESYPKVSDFSKSEILPEQWCEIIRRLKLNNPDVFIILYGGEPFLYRGFDQIIGYCNKNNVNYTVITNNTDAVQERIFDIFNRLGPYKGFTSSVDPVMLAGGESDDITSKSRSGFSRLQHIRKIDMAEDVVAEITVTKDTVKYLYKTISMLTGSGIWSSITVVDDHKNQYYDFSNVLDQSQMVQKSDEVKKEFDRIFRGSSMDLLVHIPELLPEIFKMLPSNMKCNIPSDVHNISIDPDGHARLCLRIRGIQSPNVLEYIDEKGNVSPQYVEALSADYNKCCQGCNWTCMAMSSKFSKNIISHI